MNPNNQSPPQNNNSLPSVPAFDSQPPSSPNPVVSSSPTQTPSSTSASVQSVPPVVPPMPTQTPMSPPPDNHSKPSKLLLALILVFFVVLGALGFVLFKNSSQSSAPPISLPPPQAEVSTAPSEPTPTLTDEQEVQNVDTSSSAADLKDVKTDLQGL